MTPNVRFPARALEPVKLSRRRGSASRDALPLAVELHREICACVCDVHVFLLWFGDLAVRLIGLLRKEYTHAKWRTTA